jgi:predicted ATP-dependent endonuclease of OLD family
MKIKKLKVHNWRSIKDVEIDFMDLMVFIGQNNHGKSNVLSAIHFFFGAITCSDLDFAYGTTDLFVEITFSDLDDHDRGQFGKYLTADSTITVRKSITKGESFEYHGYKQIPSEDWLREENIPSYASRETIVGTPLNAFVPPTGRVLKEMVREAQLAYIAANADTLTFSYELEATNFLGLKSVAQGIFGEVYFIPAVKNASDEFNVKGKSVFNQLFTNVINDMSATNEEYKNVKLKVAELTQSLNKTITDGSSNQNRPKQISRLEQLLEEELSSWNTTIDIEITPPNIDEVLKVGTNVWLNDGYRTDVNRKGNGLQRSLIFALIKAWAKVTREQRDRELESEEEAAQRKASRSTYFIFEEPELYLHPQAQRELYASLKELSENQSQVLLSTHSSAFIDLDSHESICILYKNTAAEGTKRLQCLNEIFTSQDDKKEFKMTYWINPDRGELFFAKKVILVEGETDKIVLSFLANQLGCFKYDYTIIDCGSKDAIPLYMHLLNNFKLPYIAVYDIDHQTWKNPDEITMADKSTAEITSKLDGTLGSLLDMVNDIEEEIGVTVRNKKNKAYHAMKHVSASGYVISASLETKIRTIFS